MDSNKTYWSPYPKILFWKASITERERDVPERISQNQRTKFM